MPTKEMLKSGTVVTLICALMTFALFPLLAPTVYPNLNKFPEWAAPDNITITTIGTTLP